MAVESRHLNREMIMNGIEGSENIYSNGGIKYGVPMYGTAAATESVPAPAKTMKAADSGLTYALPPVSRKRSAATAVASFVTQNYNHHHHRRSAVASAVNSYSFLGEDISLQIQRQQLEIDHFIAQHNEKVGMEIEERRKKNYGKIIISAIEQNVMKKLKSKEEEIEKIGKLNWALEEQVKTLCYENQMWRDLAQMNEATGNALRNNLEQVLAQHHHYHHHHGVVAETALLDDDAQSGCGNNYNDKEEIDHTGQWRSLSVTQGYNGNCNDNDNDDNGNRGGVKNSMCRKCGKEESCVLLLPCRHLCMCAVCGSSINICPICQSVKNASLNVIF